MNLAIFGSGNGSNAKNIIKYFAKNRNVHIKLIITNNAAAYIRQHGIQHNITSLYIETIHFRNNPKKIINVLQEHNIHYIILAGFLVKIPSKIIQKYNQKVINIHPSLLPKYGGKGMYGKHVHQEVFKNKEKETGITIHLVNEEYDKGKIITQIKTDITPFDSAEDIEHKVRKLELEHFPKNIEKFIFKT